jgi:hypothetical protein
VGRAKGFIVAKGDDTKLPTPEKETKECIYIKLVILKKVLSFPQLFK